MAEVILTFRLDVGTITGGLLGKGLYAVIPLLMVSLLAVYSTGGTEFSRPSKQLTLELNNATDTVIDLGPGASTDFYFELNVPKRISGTTIAQIITISGEC